MAQVADTAGDDENGDNTNSVNAPDEIQGQVEDTGDADDNDGNNGGNNSNNSATKPRVLAPRVLPPGTFPSDLIRSGKKNYHPEPKIFFWNPKVPHCGTLKVIIINYERIKETMPENVPMKSENGMHVIKAVNDRVEKGDLVLTKATTAKDLRDFDEYTVKLALQAYRYFTAREVFKARQYRDLVGKSAPKWKARQSELEELRQEELINQFNDVKGGKKAQNSKSKNKETKKRQLKNKTRDESESSSSESESESSSSSSNSSDESSSTTPGGSLVGSDEEYHPELERKRVAPGVETRGQKKRLSRASRQFAAPTNKSGKKKNNTTKTQNSSKRKKKKGKTKRKSKTKSKSKSKSKSNSVSAASNKTKTKKKSTPIKKRASRKFRSSMTGKKNRRSSQQPGMFDFMSAIGVFSRVFITKCVLCTCFIDKEEELLKKQQALKKAQTKTREADSDSSDVDIIVNHGQKMDDSQSKRNFNETVQQYYKQQQLIQHQEREKHDAFLKMKQDQQDRQRLREEERQQMLKQHQQRQQQLASQFGQIAVPMGQPMAASMTLSQQQLQQHVNPFRMHQQQMQQELMQKEVTGQLLNTQVLPSTRVESSIAQPAQDYSSQFSHLFKIEKQDKKHTNQQVANMTEEEKQETFGFLTDKEGHVRMPRQLVRDLNLLNLVAVNSFEKTLGFETVLIPKQPSGANSELLTLIENVFNEDIKKGGPIDPNAEYLPISKRGKLGCLNYDLTCRLVKTQNKLQSNGSDSGNANLNNQKESANDEIKQLDGPDRPRIAASKLPDKFGGEYAQFREPEMKQWGGSLTVDKHTSPSPNYGLRTKTLHESYYVSCTSQKLYKWMAYIRVKGDQITGMCRDEIEDIDGNSFDIMCTTTHLDECKGLVPSGYLWSKSFENGGYRGDDDDETNSKEQSHYGDTLLVPFSELKLASKGVAAFEKLLLDKLLTNEYLDYGYQTFGNPVYLKDKNHENLKHLQYPGEEFVAAVQAEKFYNQNWLINFNFSKLLAIVNGDNKNDKQRWVVSFRLRNMLARCSGGAIDPSKRMNTQTLKLIVKYWGDKLCILFV